MGYRVDEEILKWSNEEYKIPKQTREKIDSVYSQIINEQKEVKPHIEWKKTVSIISIAAVMMMFLLTNNQVLASLNQWFDFSNQWKNSLGDDVLISNGKSHSNKELSIVVNKNISTPYSVGFDVTIGSLGDYRFKNNSNIWLDYVIKNGDGTEIINQSEDGKKSGKYNDTTYLQSTDVIVTGTEDEMKTGFYHFLRDTRDEKIPILKNATLEISRVSIPGENIEFTGNWIIPLTDGKDNGDYSVKKYKVKKESKDIEVKSAVLTKSNFVIEYKFNKEMNISDMELLNSYILDEQGNKFKNNQYSLEENNTVIRVNIPLTSQAVPQEMTLIVEEINGDSKYEVSLMEN